MSFRSKTRSRLQHQQSDEILEAQRRLEDDLAIYEELLSRKNDEKTELAARLKFVERELRVARELAYEMTLACETMRNEQKTKPEEAVEEGRLRSESTAAQRRAEKLQRQTRKVVSETQDLWQQIDAMSEELQQQKEINAELEAVNRRAHQELLLQQKQRDLHRAAVVKGSRKILFLQQKLDDSRRANDSLRGRFEDEGRLLRDG